jgi:hypothetical protein
MMRGLVSITRSRSSDGCDRSSATVPIMC